MTRDERQEIVVQNFFKAKGRGIFLGSVGFGKSRVAINIIKKLKEKKDSLTVTILVPTTILLKQWKKIINDYELNDTCEVRTFKSLSKKLVNSDLLIIDELHASLSKNGIDRIRDSRFPLFLGLTATINRIDENEKFILKHFPIFDTVTKEECIKNNWAAQNTIYKVEIATDLSEYLIINESYNHHFSTFNFNFHLVNKILKEGYKSQYSYKIAESMNIPLNDLFAHATNVMRLTNKRKQWLYNHPVKVAITDEIIKARQDSKIITFSESQQIAESLPYGKTVHSGMTKKKQREIIDEFTAMDKGVLHTVKSLQAGIDIPGLNVGVATSFNSSKINRTQTAGRIERVEGDKTSEFFNLVIKNTIEEKWFANANAGVDYITISPEDLEDVLAGKNIRFRKNKNVDFDYIF